MIGTVGLSSLRFCLHTKSQSHPHVVAKRAPGTTPPPSALVSLRLLCPSCLGPRQNSRMWVRLQTPCEWRSFEHALEHLLDQSYSRPPLLKTVLQEVAAFVEGLQRIDVVVERAASVQRHDMVAFKIFRQEFVTHGTAPLLARSHTLRLKRCDTLSPRRNAALINAREQARR